jgi:hypothetical protein
MAKLFEEAPGLASLRLRQREQLERQNRVSPTSSNPYIVRGSRFSPIADLFKRRQLGSQIKEETDRQNMARALLSNPNLERPEKQQSGFIGRLPQPFQQPVRRMVGSPVSRRSIYDDLEPRTTAELQGLAGYNPAAPKSTLTTLQKHALQLFPDSLEERRAWIDEQTAWEPGAPRLKMWEEQAAIADTAEATMQEMEFAKVIINPNSPNSIYTGLGADVALGLQKVLDLFVDNEDLSRSIAKKEWFKTLTSKQALYLRNPKSGLGLTGNTSNADREFLVSAVFGLGKSNEANAALLIIESAKLRRKAALARERGEALLSYRTGVGDPRAVERRNAIINEPLLNPDELAALEQLLLQNANNPRTSDQRGVQYGNAYTGTAITNGAFPRNFDEAQELWREANPEGEISETDVGPTTSTSWVDIT